MVRSTSLALLPILLVTSPAFAQSAPPSEPPPHPATAATAPAAVPQPTPAPSPVPAPTPAELQQRRVAVDVESTQPDAILERRVSVKESMGAFIILPMRSTEDTWEQVCVAPCNGVELDRYSSYRIAAANHISSSGRFTLPQGSNALHLKVDAGSLTAHRAGQALGAVGLAAMIVGVSLLIAAPSFHHEDDARLAGWITGGGGLVALGIGIPLALLTHTRVSSADGRSLASSTPGAIAF